MSRKVEELLAGGYRTAYDKTLAIRYMLLGPTLRDTSTELIAVADRLQNRLGVFDQLTAIEMVERGKPFFWQTVHRLRRSLSRGDDPSPSILARHLLMVAFDAFFEQLEDGAEVPLDAVPDAEVVLPKLGVRCATGGREVRLRRIDGSHLELDFDREVERIDLEAPEATCTLPRFRIPAFAETRLLAFRDPALFPTEAFHRIAPELETPAAHDLALRIGDGFELVREVDPELAAHIDNLIDWFVPLSSPDGNVDNAFSSSDLAGLIFISEADRGLHLAETLVHEYHHNELNLILEVEPLFESRPDELFYSPWREDPRPLAGLIHALHVFVALADFYRRALDVPALAEHHDACRERLRCIVSQLRTGLLQVPVERLTDLGRELLAGMEEELRQQRGAENSRATLPAAQQRHLESWRRRHPQHAERLRLP